MMTITDMTANAKAHAIESGEARDAYWGEYPSVMRLLAAYYGGPNTAADASNYNRLRS